MNRSASVDGKTPTRTRSRSIQHGTPYPALQTVFETPRSPATIGESTISQVQARPGVQRDRLRKPDASVKKATGKPGNGRLAKVSQHDKVPEERRMEATRNSRSLIKTAAQSRPGRADHAAEHSASEVSDSDGDYSVTESFVTALSVASAATAHSMLGSDCTELLAPSGKVTSPMKTRTKLLARAVSAPPRSSESLISASSRGRSLDAPDRPGSQTNICASQFEKLTKSNMCPEHSDSARTVCISQGATHTDPPLVETSFFIAATPPKHVLPEASARAASTGKDNTTQPGIQGAKRNLFLNRSSVPSSGASRSSSESSRIVGSEQVRQNSSRIRAPSSQVHHRPQGLLPCNRVKIAAKDNLALAHGDAARQAFSKALLEGSHQPRCAKLCFVGAARAGKTSTLRSLAGLPLRAEEESTLGLAVWELCREFIVAGCKHRWQLHEARAALGTEFWDGGVAQYVADSVRSVVATGCSGSSSSNGCALPASHDDKHASLDASVMKRMPYDLIAKRLGENVNRGTVDGAVVLEAYDFGGQEVYYNMHHLFLTNFGIYLACIDLLAVQRGTTDSVTHGDIMEDRPATNTWEALEWWLASIAIFAPDSPVAIVGTHDDCLDPDVRAQVHKDVNDRIVALCKRSPQFNDNLWVNEEAQLCFFPVDNSGNDGGVSALLLRETIDGMASDLLQGHLGQPVPLRWAHFWAILQKSPDERPFPMCRMEDLWRRSANYGFESIEELQSFLLHFQRLGVLLHFPDSTSEELRELVCFNPAWVADAAATVLTAKDRVIQGCTRFSAELREKGMLHSELLSAIWRAKTFSRHQRQLLELLQALDLLMPWGHDRQSAPVSQHARAHEVYLVPALLPLRPMRQQGESKYDQMEEDAIVVFLDFHGLLERLLPTLFPRVLGVLSRSEAAAQILSIYSNYVLFTISAQGQARGDSARSQGGRRQVHKFIVCLQPCAGTELLKCSMRPRRIGNEPGHAARPSWRHMDRLLHAFRDAVASWMPRIGFKAGIRCPACATGRAHPVDVHTVLQDDVPLCPRSGEPIEDLPAWLMEWRAHVRPPSNPPRPASARGTSSTAASASQRLVHVEYMYASPLDASNLDVRTEMETIGALPGVGTLSVRTANTETLGEIWRNGPCWRQSIAPAQPSVLCLSAHVASSPLISSCHRPSLLLEDIGGCKHVLSAEDLTEILSTKGRPNHSPFEVVVLQACHSEHLAQCFLTAGANCVIACSGAVFDAAARAFIRAFLAAVVTDGDLRVAFATAQRTIRLSPQPGLRAEAERFRIFPENSDERSRSPEQRWPRAMSPLGNGHMHSCTNCDTRHSVANTPPRRGKENLADADANSTVLRARPPLPAPTPAIEDFVGRAQVLASIAQVFLSSRRVAWLHGPWGSGKSAVVTEFCRFFSLPGDRLFSPSPDARAGSGGGARLLRLAGVSPDDALRELREALGGGGIDSMIQLDASASGRKWLIALDGIDGLLEFAGMPESDTRSSPGAEFWSQVASALSSTQQLQILLTSRKPLYAAPFPCKVVAYEVPPLEREDAALLLLRRSHRPLYQRDLETAASAAATSANGGGDPVSLKGRRREFLQQLSSHPLLTAVGGLPGNIVEAASKVTPQLPSLFFHPLLQASAASSSTSCVGEGEPDGGGSRGSPSCTSN